MLSSSLTFLLAGIGCLFGIVWMFFKEDSYFRLHWVNGLFFALICLAFSSVSWATNPGLAFSESVFLLFLFLFVLIIKWIDFSGVKPFLLFFIPAIYFIMLGLSSYFVFPVFYESVLKNNLYLNSNALSVLLLYAWPFIFILIKKTSKRLLRILFILSVIWGYLIVVKVASIGCSLIGPFFVLLYFLIEGGINWKWMRKGLLLLSALSGLLSLVLWLDSALFEEIHSQITTESGRLGALQITWQLFREVPFLGCGYGNWAVEVYQFPALNNLELSNPLFLNRLQTHNIYLKIIGELGLVGLSIFLVLMLAPFYYFFRNPFRFDDFDRCCLYCFMLFLLFSGLYGLSIPKGKLSPFVLIGFGFYGIIAKKIPTYFSKEVKWIKPFFLTTSLVCFIYYGYIFYKIQSLANLGGVSTQSSTTTLLQKEALYHPFLFNYVPNNDYLPFYFATEWAAKNETSKARFYFEIALKENPYNINYLNNYAIFLIEEADFLRARQIANRSFLLHPTFYPTQYILSMVAFQAGQYEKALARLSYREELRGVLAGFEAQKQNSTVNKGHFAYLINFTQKMLEEAEMLAQKIREAQRK